MFNYFISRFLYFTVFIVNHNINSENYMYMFVLFYVFISIPSVANGFPDSRTSLLHQKLQLLNICMERRRIREGGLPFSMAQRGQSSGQEDSEDEFFDCPEEDVEGVCVVNSYLP